MGESCSQLGPVIVIVLEGRMAVLPLPASLFCGGCPSLGHPWEGEPLSLGQPFHSKYLMPVELGPNVE